jgi:NADH dehydrogenase FAD-containing subunit
MAQTAMYDAQFITGNILRQVRGKVAREYVPKKPIYAIPVGARWAAVLWGGVRIYGRLGWMLRRLADLRLYITFLPPRKALTAWHYGSVVDEAPCPICKT